jgi:large subunit ribosomal protein L10
MSKNYELKKTVVADIKDKFERAKCVVLVDYRGLTVAEDTALRNEFRKAGCEYAVLKNTMIDLAIKEMGYEADMKPFLNGPTAVAFSYDDLVAPAKVVKTFIDKTKKLEIKCGVCDGAYLDQAGVTALADLPSKEVLIAKIMGSMMSAVSKFVYVVEAIRKQKAGEE